MEYKGKLKYSPDVLVGKINKGRFYEGRLGQYGKVVFWSKQIKNLTVGREYDGNWEISELEGKGFGFITPKSVSVVPIIRVTESSVFVENEEILYNIQNLDKIAALLKGADYSNAIWHILQKEMPNFPVFVPEMEGWQIITSTHGSHVIGAWVKEYYPESFITFDWGNYKIKEYLDAGKVFSYNGVAGIVVKNDPPSLKFSTKDDAEKKATELVQHTYSIVTPMFLEIKFSELLTEEISVWTKEIGVENERPSFFVKYRIMRYECAQAVCEKIGGEEFKSFPEILKMPLSPGAWTIANYGMSSGRRGIVKNKHTTWDAMYFDTENHTIELRGDSVSYCKTYGMPSSHYCEATDSFDYQDRSDTFTTEKDWEVSFDQRNADWLLKLMAESKLAKSFNEVKTEIESFYANEKAEFEKRQETAKAEFEKKQAQETANALQEEFEQEKKLQTAIIQNNCLDEVAKKEGYLDWSDMADAYEGDEEGYEHFEKVRKTALKKADQIISSLENYL